MYIPLEMYKAEVAACILVEALMVVASRSHSYIAIASYWDFILDKLK